jgi:hypothetical protein
MATAEQKATIRDNVFQESFNLAQKQRHGMFSVPVSLAIGDDQYFKPTEPRRDAEGGVITAPRNFTTKNVKKGHIDSVLFSKPSYVSQGDPFKEPAKAPMKEFVKDGFKLGGHTGNFKPAKDTQRKVKADFEHMVEFKEVSKNRKGPDGAVMTDPKNFLTSPPKKGTTYKGTLFGGKTEHLPDPFERKRELEKAERKEHHAKMQDKAFSQKVRGRETFATIKEAFGEDRDYPNKKSAPPRQPLMTHDMPFKPSNPPKIGYNKTLDKFPAYIEDPLKFA